MFHNLPDYFSVTNVGNGQFILPDPVSEFRPLHWLIKEDGAIGDKPSFAILGAKANGNNIIMQISAEMFRPAYEAMKQIYERGE